MAFNSDRIARARLASDMSRDDLAYAIRRVSGNSIKATGQSVRRWEKGTNTPGADVIGAIAQATGKDVDFFYAGDDKADGSDEEDEAALRLERHTKGLVSALTDQVRRESAREGSRSR